MLLLVVYDFTDNYMTSIIAHLFGLPLLGILLWRVERVSKFISVCVNTCAKSSPSGNALYIGVSENCWPDGAAKYCPVRKNVVSLHRGKDKNLITQRSFKFNQHKN